MAGVGSEKMGRGEMGEDAAARARALDVWSAPVVPVPLAGGLSNANFIVDDAGRRHVVRIGGDVPAHAVWRWNEVAISRAAHAAGLAPEVLHHEADALVLAHIEGRTYGPEDVRDPGNLAAIVALVRRCHREIPVHLDVPGPFFWVFQVNRRYLGLLDQDNFRLKDRMDEFAALNHRLEGEFGPLVPVFCHNDLLAANLIDDGARLWLIDWEYGAWNDAMFDLANLASNNELPPEAEGELLRLYYGRPVTAEDRRRLRVMKRASLLREALWSLVSETHLTLDIDYAAYSDEVLDRLDREVADDGPPD